MKDFKKELFKNFNRYSYFKNYFRGLDPEQDGTYMVFGAFGELLEDLLLGKIDNHKLFMKQCAFIDEICSVHDAEWNNVLRSEVFSIMNTKELLKLQPFLSEDSNKQLSIYLPK